MGLSPQIQKCGSCYLDNLSPATDNEEQAILWNKLSFLPRHRFAATEVSANL
jgi:hypothetical protein